MVFKTFIKANDEFCCLEKSVSAPYIRKSFELDFCPECANLQITASGFYEVYINGQNITKGFLAPYISNPTEVLFYDEYDVSSYLSKGENVIGIILGNGFANQDATNCNFNLAGFRAPLVTSLNMNVSGENKSFHLESDENFKTHPSPILYDMYRFGTHYDARKEISGWCDKKFDDSSWENVKIAEYPTAKIEKSIAEPITKQYELKPVLIEKQEDFNYIESAWEERFAKNIDCDFAHIDSGYLYDFGYNCAGVCRLKIKGEKGQKVILRHGETLKDGKFNINTIFTVRKGFEEYINLLQTDVYILKGGQEEIFIPAFTYHGFRYVFVEGITEKQATRDLLTYIVFNSNITKRADFKCSNETINKLYEMGIRSDLSNFHYFPTDCPHREKNGWTGDISFSAEQLSLNFDAVKSFDQWLKMVRYAQKENGEIPPIVPDADDWGMGEYNGPAWDSVCVNLPFYTYKYSGDKNILLDNADMIKKYLNYISSMRNENGLVEIGLGDWAQPYYEDVGLLSPKKLTSSVMVYDMAVKSQYIFKKINMLTEAMFAEKLANEMRQALRDNFVDRKTCIAKGNCQTSQVLFLAHKIFAEDEMEKAYRHLLKIIGKDGYISCGAIGLLYIFRFLTEMGDEDIAYDLLVSTKEPSYGSMIARGATALCETTIKNGCQESHNHHFLGDILYLFISEFAGLKINPYLDDVNEILVEPHLPSKLNFAECEYLTEKGKIRVLTERKEESIYVTLSVPVGVHGVVIVNGKKHLIKAGENVYC